MTLASQNLANHPLNQTDFYLYISINGSRVSFNDSKHRKTGIYSTFQTRVASL